MTREKSSGVCGMEEGEGAQGGFSLEGVREDAAKQNK